MSQCAFCLSSAFSVGYEFSTLSICKCVVHKISILSVCVLTASSFYITFVLMMEMNVQTHNPAQ